MKPVIGISGNILINKGNTFSGYRRSYVNQDYFNAGVLYLNKNK